MKLITFVLHYLWQRAAKHTLNLVGWNLIAELPPVQKYLLIGAHHTSNWDFPLVLLMMAALGLRLRWIGKDSLFKGPKGWVMRWLGGIPVERDARKNFVAQMVDFYQENEKMVVTISPEGTRSARDHWKTGFYHIASGANIPIAMGFLDYSCKQCGIGGYFYPTGDLNLDAQVLHNFYVNIKGKFPDKQGQVRFLTQDERKEKR